MGTYKLTYSLYHPGSLTIDKPDVFTELWWHQQAGEIFSWHLVIRALHRFTSKIYQIHFIFAFVMSYCSVYYCSNLLMNSYVIKKAKLKL